MTRANRRRSAGRLAFQLALLAPLGSAIFGGCSSGVKTVSVDCPTGGTGAFAGGAGVNGGASSGASAGVLGMAGEAGQGQAGAEGGEGGGAASSQGGEAGEAGSSTGGRGGSSGTAGHSGGHGGTAGGSAGGPAVALCGDKVTTPPEFCDDGTNTDLSYGCSACTTLPPPTGGASQGGAGSVPEQCDACLQEHSKPTSCYGCMDYRACYACLRRQPDDPRFRYSNGSICSSVDRDDIPGGSYTTPEAFSDLCFNPNSPDYQAATGGPAGSEPRGLVCQALVACLLRTGCVLGPQHGLVALYVNCYCGVVPHGSTCQDPTFVPNGPCANEVRDANASASTGNALTLEIGVNASDADPTTPDHVLGVANNIAACAADADGCLNICFPNSSSTGGTAGTGGSSGHGGS